LMTQRHLRTTLFPYTTLFRSDKDGIPNRNLVAMLQIFFLYGVSVDQGAVAALEIADLEVLRLATYHAVSAGNCGVGNRQQVGFIDRKSTRLNSSHVAISYAVF